MSQRKKALLQSIALLVIIGLIAWHTVYWYLSGVHLTIFNYIKEGKSYLSVLYNMSLTIVSGILLGILMGKILEVSGYQSKIAKNAGDDK